MMSYIDMGAVSTPPDGVGLWAAFYALLMIAIEARASFVIDSTGMPASAIDWRICGGMSSAGTSGITSRAGAASCAATARAT